MRRLTVGARSKCHLSANWPEVTKRCSDTHKRTKVERRPDRRRATPRLFSHLPSRGRGGGGDVNLAKRPPRDRNRPDFVYGKPCRIDKMSENHRLLGFPTRFADPVFLCCPLMRIREAFRYFWPTQLLPVSLTLWRSHSGVIAWTKKSCRVTRFPASRERRRQSSCTMK